MAKYFHAPNRCKVFRDDGPRSGAGQVASRPDRRRVRRRKIAPRPTPPLTKPGVWDVLDPIYSFLSL